MESLGSQRRYECEKLPDFYSVRNQDQINYSLEGMENKKCYLFLDNGFTSNIIEPNKRDIQFIWDGFLLFTDSEITPEDIQNGVDLYQARLVALQRMSLLHQKSNSPEVKHYIIEKLQERNIPYEEMPDTNYVDGYPSQCDLWSTRDFSVLLDVIDCVSDGQAYYNGNSYFRFEITFPQSGFPNFLYSHYGAVILHGSDGTAISRLIHHNKQLRDTIENIVGTQKLYSFLEGKDYPGVSISDLHKGIQK